MTRHRKARKPKPVPVSHPSLASQLGRVALEDGDAAENHLPGDSDPRALAVLGVSRGGLTSSAAAGGAGPSSSVENHLPCDPYPRPLFSNATEEGGESSTAVGGGPSSTVEIPSAASRDAASPPGDPEGATPAPSAAEETATCACCLVIITEEVFRCSRCLLVAYCGKDCQASEAAYFATIANTRDAETLTPPFPPTFQGAHWRAAHRVVCGQGGGGIAPQPQAADTPADRARWQAACNSIDILIGECEFEKATVDLERLLASMEGALGKEAEELLRPLELRAKALLRSGRLDDAYNVMMRSMTLCEKHHGEEGLMTCRCGC